MKNKFILTLVLVMLFPGVALANSIPSSAEDVRPIKLGQVIPPLTLKDIQGNDFNLNHALSEKPTVLIFYRGSWCPYCNIHLGELKTIESELKDLGFQIIAVSPDLPINLQASIEKHALTYKLVSDSQAVAIKALNLAFTVDSDIINKYHNYGIDLEKASGEKHHILPVPAALIIDTAGVVQFSFTSPNYKVRVDLSVLLAAAKAVVK